jgi:arylsulfatase A-like enzyme
MRARFPILSWTALCFAVVALTACQSRPASNVVVICIDTVRFDSFLYAGPGDTLAPWIERAQVYDNATASGPWTIPSVASVLTGLHPVQHTAGRFPGEVANLATLPPSPLPEDFVTLPERLRDAGFRTGAFVSHPFFHAELGLDQGFEVLAARKAWHKDLEKFREWHAKLDPTERFFGYLHFMEAHDWHLGSPDALQARLAKLDSEVREFVQAQAGGADCPQADEIRCLRRQVYAAAVLEMRQAVAAVLQALEDDGVLDSTVVLLYSDHGEEFWEHETEAREAAQDPRGFYGFGHGQSLYQELLHIPLLAWIPGRKGMRHEPLVSLTDVYPSVLAWLGLDGETQRLAGQVLPTKRRPAVDADRVVYSSGIAYGLNAVSARSADLKTIFQPHADSFAYYDLAADPGEQAPLSARPDLTMVFDTLVGDYLEQARDVAVTAGRFTDDQIRQLKAIGYLQGYEADSAAPATAEPAPADESEQPASGEEQP